MSSPIDAGLLPQILSLIRQVGREILDVYRRAELEIHTKDDDSPLTAADLRSHRALKEGLAALTPDWPLLSEESTLPPFDERRAWRRYWLIDPLDGTKEFISRTGEFTVNLALIERGRPVFGAVHVPPTDVTYYGGDGIGAYKQSTEGLRAIHSRSLAPPSENTPITVVASRRHGTEAVTALLERIRERAGPVTTRSVGSALKLCLVAEGVADLYPRLGPTSEWDTAAAQAVVEAAGGAVVDRALNPLRYNQTDSILNPDFFVLGDPAYDWRALLG